VSTKVAVFWVVAPYSLVEVYQRFRGPCCLHYQGDRLHGATTQKTAIFIIIIVVVKHALLDDVYKANKIFQLDIYYYVVLITLRLGYIYYELITILSG
jgi:hypothetical protein